MKTCRVSGGVVVVADYIRLMIKSRLSRSMVSLLLIAVLMEFCIKDFA